MQNLLARSESLPQHPTQAHALTASPCIGSKTQQEQGHQIPSLGQRPRTEDGAPSFQIAGGPSTGSPASATSAAIAH